MTYDKEQRHTATDSYREGKEAARREENAALSGMTLGFLLVLIAGAIAGTFFYFSRRTEPTPAVSPSVTPNAISPAPEKETILREEKVREIVPVPQSEAPQPNVNIVVPNNPAPPAAPPDTTAPSSSVPEEAMPKTEESPAPSPSPDNAPNN